MLANKTTASSIENEPNFNIEGGTFVAFLIAFIEKHLIDYANKYVTEGKQLNEEDLNQEISIYLNSKGRVYPFFFSPEYKKIDSTSKGKKRAVDIGVIYAQTISIESKQIFSIECKRLPTPGTGRQREYVEGNLGGIERFKREQHGAGLSFSAMIGYIEEDTFEHWFEQINQWIENLFRTNTDPSITWSENDLLKIVDCSRPTIASYKSYNNRIKDSITLHHVWIKMFK